MKTRETTPGKTYSVHTSSGCTVSDKSGWSKAIDAPDGYFTAHAGEVTIDGDDAADIRELFKLAPQQRLAILGVLGGGTPAWLAQLKAELTALLDGSQFELDWLSAKNTLVIHTDRVSDELLAVVKSTAEAAMPVTATLVQYNHNIEISWRDINKYAACVTMAEMEAVNPNYQKDLTSDGTWVYPIPSLDGNVGYGEKSPFSAMKALHFFDEGVTFDHIISAGTLFDDRSALFIYSNLEEIPRTWTFSNSRNLIRAFLGTKVQLIPSSIKFRKLVNADEMFRLTTLLHIEDDLELVSLSSADNMFQYCQLDAESVPRVLDSLPSYTSGTHPLTIGIHIDHQHDEEVLAAIANAEAKGWTLTVQWNGTPTSTASTMRFGQLIYAKVGEMERPDGTTERVLDWGHYVTDWEARGYEQFRSLESAYRYFELPMPEEEL